MIEIHRRCRREIDGLPLAVREALADAIARLELGHSLSMPLSRGVFLLHAFKKTTEKTPQRNIEIAQARLREMKQ